MTNYPLSSIHKANAQGHKRKNEPDSAFCAEALVKDPSLGPKVKKFIKNPVPDPVQIPDDQMLSLILRKNIPKDTATEVISLFNGVTKPLGFKVCTFHRSYHVHFLQTR